MFIGRASEDGQWLISDHYREHIAIGDTRSSSDLSIVAKQHYRSPSVCPALHSNCPCEKQVAIPFTHPQLWTNCNKIRTLSAVAHVDLDLELIAEFVLVKHFVMHCARVVLVLLEVLALHIVKVDSSLKELGLLESVALLFFIALHRRRKCA